MRKRMDFSTISDIISENWYADGLTNTEYIHTLFCYAFEQEKYKITEPDSGDISRFLNGQRGIPKEIVRLYQQEDGISYLKMGVEKVLVYTADSEYIADQTEKLLRNDMTISQQQKEKLLEHRNNIELFLTECMLYGMARKFVRSDKKKQVEETLQVKDFLLDWRLPSVGSVFLGREKELKEIHNYMEQLSCLFLEGIGGIGKSELAKQYAATYRKEYGNIIYLRYVDSLEKTIAGLNFVDDERDMSEEKRFKMHYNFFKSLPSDTLIILDNFETTPDKEPLFHEFLSLDFQVLATTRSHIEGISTYQVGEIEDFQKLLELFYTYAPQSREKESVVKEIIEEVYRHTLTVEMAAKTLKVACLEPEELLGKLLEEGIKLSNPNKISVTKDSKTVRERLYCHIQTLFELQALDSEYIDILRYMTIMPEQGIPQAVFHEWLRTDNYNWIEELIGLGWVKRNEENYSILLHPMIHEVIQAYQMPSITNCEPILKGIFLDCSWCVLDLEYYRDVLNTIESVYKNIEIDDIKTAGIYMQYAMNYLDKYGNTDDMEYVLNLMEKTLSLGEENSKETVAYYCYRGMVQMQRGDYSEAVKIFREAILCIEPVKRENAELASNLYCNIGASYMYCRNLKLGKKYIKKAIETREKYQIPFNADTISTEALYVQLLFVEGKYQKAIDRLTEYIVSMEFFGYGMRTTLGKFYFLRGYMERYIGNMVRAKDDFIKAQECLAILPPDDDWRKSVEEILEKGKIKIPYNSHLIAIREEDPNHP